MKRKVTISIDSVIYQEFQKVCNDNAIMLSKKLEIFMKDFSNQIKKTGSKKR
jgi:hypothetical protein